jgi:hypothetical protein
MLEWGILGETGTTKPGPEHLFKEQWGMRLAIVVTAFAAGIGLAEAGGADPVELIYVPKSTKKICQLTGDFDRGAGKPTLSQTGKRYGVIATDLGSSFEHKGKLYFLFGPSFSSTRTAPCKCRMVIRASPICM